MKKLYEVNEEVMVRLPTVSEKEKNTDVKELFNDPVFREQVLISSKSIYDQATEYLVNGKTLSNKKKRNLEQSLLKYALRRNTRTTPFGLYSAVGIAKTSTNKENFAFDEKNFEHVARADLSWIFNVIKKEELNGYQHLEFKINPAVYTKGNRAYVLYNTETASSTESIQLSMPFKLLMDQGQNLVAFENLLATLRQAYPKQNEDKLSSFLYKLIKNEFLISNLRPPMTVSNQLEYLITELNKNAYFSERAIQLQKVDDQIKQYNKMKLGTGEQTYLTLYKEMNTLYRSTSPLQVDSLLNNDSISIPQNLVEEINEAVSFLTLLASENNPAFAHIQLYQDEFLDKYGFSQEVPLTDLFDTGNGLGAPFSYDKPENDFISRAPVIPDYNLRLRNYFLSKINVAEKKGAAIDLREKDVKKLLGDSQFEDTKLLKSLEAFFLLKKSGEKYLAYLSPGGGSQGAGKTFGRFGHLSNHFGETIKTIQDKETTKRNKYVKTCEISYVPSNIRNGNVSINPHFKEYELSLFTNNSLEVSREITIKDILIGIDNYGFYARNRKNGDLLEFQATNMLNAGISHNMLRFLHEISIYRKRSWSEFPWHRIYSDFDHIPELRYKSIVLSPERWFISTESLMPEMINDFELFKKKFSEYKEAFALPNRFYLTDYDNRIPIHFSNDSELEILFAEYKKNSKAQMRIQLQACEEGENVFVDQNDESYTAEIVVPMFSVEKETDETILPKSIVTSDFETSTKLPYDDWLYFKLYTTRKKELDLITLCIKEFCSKLEEETGIHYFFMRYIDTHPHIRLRFNASEEKLQKYTTRIFDWLKTLLSQEMIARYTIDSYEREVERYGGKELISLAEKVFMADSKVVENILYSNRLGTLDIPFELSGVLTVVDFIDQLSLEDSEIKALVHTYEKRQDSSLYFRENKKKILDEFRRTDSQMKKWATLRKESVEDYLEVYKRMDFSLEEKINIFSSFIHLHCNRLFGVDQNQEAFVMAVVGQVFNYLIHTRTREAA